MSNPMKASRTSAMAIIVVATVSAVSLTLAQYLSAPEGGLQSVGGAATGLMVADAGAPALQTSGRSHAARHESGGDHSAVFPETFGAPAPAVGPTHIPLDTR